MSSCLCVISRLQHEWHSFQMCVRPCLREVIPSVCLFISLKEIILYYRVQVSPWRYPCYIAGSALQMSKTSQSTKSATCWSPKTGKYRRSNHYRCENLTINYLTPLCIDAKDLHAIGSFVLPKLASSFEPLRQAVDVQVTHSLYLTSWVCSFSAPRRVLMRCVTRYKVVVWGLNLFYFIGASVSKSDS